MGLSTPVCSVVENAGILTTVELRPSWMGCQTMVACWMSGDLTINRDVLPPIVAPYASDVDDGGGDIATIGASEGSL